jgi:SAM-dependent methyltransferase
MMPVQVSADYYHAKKYLTLDRFVSYFTQVDEVRRLSPKTILVVGVGEGTVSSLLQANPAYRVTTCDIDPALNPDHVADIRSLPFPDGSFDTVCAFEVLEHLPFEESAKAYDELARVSARHMVVSVPHRRTGFEIVFRFPFVKTLTGNDHVRVAFRVPVRFPGHEISKQHYWEIDWYTTRLSKVRALFRTHSTIVREHTPPLDMYRRFFILEKRIDV